MKITKNAIISIIVLLVGLAGFAMSLAGMLATPEQGKPSLWTHDKSTAKFIGQDFSEWKNLSSSTAKSFIGLVFFGGIFSLILSAVVAFFGIKWTVNSIKGSFNVGFIKFIAILILVAIVFAISVAVVACGVSVVNPDKWNVDGSLK